MFRHISTMLTSLLLLGSLASCEEPLELDDLPALQPKLVVISNFSEGRAIVVTVAKSHQIGELETAEYFTNAKVDLYWQNTFLERFGLIVPDNADHPPYYRSSEHSPMAGIEYTIKVSVEGYQSVMARSSVPASVKITKFDLDQSFSEPLQNGSIERHHFSAVIDFDDPPVHQNFYHLNITQQINNFIKEGEDTLITKNSLQRADFDPRVNQNGISAHLNGGLLFEDKPDDKPLTISFAVDIDPNKQALGKTYIELRTLSKEYYLYYTSLSRSEISNPNPLTDPVIIFENIENGHGIFAGYSNTLDSVLVFQ